MTAYTISIPTADWLMIDGTMDNHVWSAEQSGRGAVARLGRGIREAGWEQIPGWPHEHTGFDTWPAEGQMSTVTLSGEQWALVVEALRMWADAGAPRSYSLVTDLTRMLAEEGCELAR